MVPWWDRSENWLPLHIWCALWWAVSLRNAWGAGLFVFCAVFDLVDYARELRMGRREEAG